MEGCQGDQEALSAQTMALEKRMLIRLYCVCREEAARCCLGVCVRMSSSGHKLQQGKF